MLKTTTSAIAIAALLSAGALAQSTDGTTTEGTTTNTTVPLQTQTEGAAEAVGEAAEDVGQAVTDAASDAADATTDAADATADAADDAVEATGDALEATGDAATDAAGDAVESAGDAVEDAGDAVENATDAMTTETTTTETVVTEEAPVAETEATETDVTETEVPLEGDAAVEAEAPAEGTPVAGQLFEQSPDTFLASSLLGTRVQSTDGDGIGDVNDMVLGADGSVEGVVVGVGGFLGIGEKDVAVQFDAIQIEQEAETGELTFVLNATRAELEAAPAFRTQDEIIAEQQAEQPVAVDPVVGEPAGDAGAETTVITE